MFCAKCGVKLDDSARFCYSCGAKASRAAGVSSGMNASPGESAGLASATPGYSVPDNGTANPHSYGSPASEPQAPKRPSYPPPDASVIVQSTATVQQGSPAGAVRPAPSYAKKEEPLNNRVAAGIFSVLLALTFLVVSAGAMALFCIQMLLSPDNVTKMVNRIDIDSILDELNVADMIYDGLSPDFIQTYGIRERDIQNLLESPEVKAFATEQLSGLLLSLIQGDFTFRLDVGDVVDFVQENSGFIESEIGYEISKSDLDKIETALDAAHIRDIMNLGGTLDALVPNIGWFDLVMSRASLIVLLSVSAVLIVLMFCVNRRRVRMGFLCTAVPMLLNGIAFAACGLTLQLILSGLLTGTDWGAGLVSDILPSLRFGLTYSGLIVFAAGLLCIGLFVIFRRVKKN